MVETMLKLHGDSSRLTADSRRLAASDGCSTRSTSEPLAVSRRPMALPDALVAELSGRIRERQTGKRT
jgi:hypothetical protein